MKDIIEDTAEKLQIDKKNWTKVKFGAVAIQQKKSVDRDKTDLTFYVKGEHMRSQDLHLREWGELTDEYLGPAFIRYFEKDDILYGSRRTYLRKVVIAPFEGITSNTTLVIKANEKLIDKRFLPFVMMSEGFTDHSIKNSKGSVNPYINWKDLANYEFLLPPKAEQIRLAELLWAMDEVIEKEKGVLGKIEILKEAIHKDSVDYGYSSKNNNIPNNWRLLKIKEFATVQAGSTPLRATNDFFDDGNIPWVKTLDLNNGEIHFTEEKITELAIEKTSCKKRQKDTVLVAMYGGFNQIGRTGILKIEAATNQAVSAIMVNKKVINPEYLLIVLNAKVDYWKKVAISSRKDPNITKVDVDNFPVPVPPLEIQFNIIEKLKQNNDSISLLESKILASQSLQKSLINQIF